ncbi:SDR family NAD(P)-dependent oxidoreductase [Phyllobacterium sp. TAF24]|uniref:SDR family NAD(P)-dependent oxidoreductase n=1 Tax=Phyllobacterium sp. TAF24 TaxID=3233068 RepID=UPI003F9DC551
MRVNNKVAIVTGGSGGIGAECARTLAREGATLIITDVADAAGEVLAKETGGVYRHHDITSLEAWQELADAVLAKYGRIDILVHCAGVIGNVKEACLDTSVEEWNRVIAINLTGTCWGCKAIVPKMLKQGTGSVVLLSSIVSFMATSVATPYGVSKAGVEQLTRSVAMAGAKDGNHVRCNSVHPGSIRSPMTDRIIADLAQAHNLPLDDAERGLMSDVPFGMRGEPSDVANLALYLASDEAKYVTGSAFVVDGGWHVVDVG